MSYDKHDFSEFDEATKSHIKTADGELTVVSGSGTIEISPTLAHQLSICGQIIP